MRRALLLAFILLAPLAAVDIDLRVVNEPKRAPDFILADRRSQEAWKSLFEPGANWWTREIEVLATLHPRDLPTLWAARLLYRGEPWTRRDYETSGLRRWRAADLEVKLAILRDARWRRDPAFVPVLERLLVTESAEAGLAVSALAGLWMTDALRGAAAAARIADPRRTDRLPPAGLPGARVFALALLIDTAGTADPATRGGLEWALSAAADPAERLAALTNLPVATRQAQNGVADLLAQRIEQITQLLRKGRLDDDETAAAVLVFSRLGETVSEDAARNLAEIVALAPRELACAAASALAGSVTWKNAIDSAPLVARLKRETDPAVRHALLGVLLRLEPKRIAEIANADGWGALARHRQALQDWAWKQYFLR